MIERRSFVAGLGAGTLVLLAPGVALAAPALAGRWAFIGGAKERRKHRESIEAASEAMPWGLRETAHKRLSSTNPVASRFEIRLDSAAVEVAYPGLDPMRSAPDGTQAKWRNSEGNRVKLVQRVLGARLTQVIKNDKGFRRTVFRVDPTDTFLSMHALIDSRFMPKAVEFRLSYKRL